MILEEGVEVWNQWRVDNPDEVPSFSYLELSERDLRGVDFSGAELNSTDLSSANLEGADFSGAYLNSANLSGANLSGVYFSDAELALADFSGADLIGSDLSHIAFWREIFSVTDCNILDIRNAPEGFREWALENGAVEIE